MEGNDEYEDENKEGIDAEEKEVKNSVHLNAYNKVFGIEGEESIMSANLRQSKDWFSKKSNSRVRSSIAGKFF